jgi:hypothetical protein
MSPKCLHSGQVCQIESEKCGQAGEKGLLQKNFSVKSDSMSVCRWFKFAPDQFSNSLLHNRLQFLFHLLSIHYTLPIHPFASQIQNGYVDSFNGRMRDELLDGELFLHLDEMKYVVERWRMDYNHYRPHSSLGYLTPAGFAEQCRRAGLDQVVNPHG